MNIEYYSRKKEAIKANTETLINAAVKAMKTNLKKVLDSGAIDIESYDEVNNPLVLPKSIVTALLEEESNQFDLGHTSFKKEFNKDKANVKNFI